MHFSYQLKGLRKFQQPLTKEYKFSERKMPPSVAATTLIHYLVSTYYAHLASVLIAYDGSALVQGSVQQDYLDAVQQAFRKQSQQGKIIGLQWMNVKYLMNMQTEQSEYEQQMLNAVNIVTEGFITIVTNTTRFLHARYFATRHATLRLKDKIYLFLCEHEKPKEFLASETLQFYPHHLMVTPTAINPPNFDMEHRNRRNDNNNHLNNVTERKAKTLQADTRPSFLARTAAAKNFILALDQQKSTPLTTGHSGSYNNRDINFELWTQKYVGTEGNLNATLLDTFFGRSLQFATSAHVYPNKLRNLQQRTLRIGTLTYVPYVRTNYVASGMGDSDSIDLSDPMKTVMFQGGEAEIIKTFCQLRNCHLRIQPYAADNWGYIFKNGTSGGMLGDLYQQHTELAIGCIYNWYSDIMEVSQFIARSAVTILGPGPEQFPRWRTNTMPFSSDVWILLLLTLVMCCLMFHFIKCSVNNFNQNQKARVHAYGNIKTFEKTILDVFAVFIQQPSADTVLEHVATRVFLAFLLCATLTIENTYSGQLKSMLTSPLFREPVDMIEKWSNTSWKWSAPSIFWIQTVEKSSIAKEQRMAKQFEVQDREFLRNASFRHDYGFGIERLYSGAVNIGDYITVPGLNNKIILKDDLYFDWTRAVAIMGWPLMPLLDLHILFCLETGLYIYWERQSSIRMLDDQIQDILVSLSIGNKPKLPPQKLTVENVSGSLLILLFGYLSAFCIFLFEGFSKRWRR